MDEEKRAEKTVRRSTEFSPSVCPHPKKSCEFKYMEVEVNDIPAHLVAVKLIFASKSFVLQDHETILIL